MMKYKCLNRQYWEQLIWARGYLVASSGNDTDEVIIKYNEKQGKEPPNEKFNVDDDVL